jgi:hypothetical protein
LRVGAPADLVAETGRASLAEAFISLTADPTVGDGDGNRREQNRA